MWTLAVDKKVEITNQNGLQHPITHLVYRKRHLFGIWFWRFVLDEIFQLRSSFPSVISVSFSIGLSIGVLNGMFVLALCTLEQQTSVIRTSNFDTDQQEFICRDYYFAPRVDFFPCIKYTIQPIKSLYVWTVLRFLNSELEASYS